jgi:hypothetical protein
MLRCLDSYISGELLVETNHEVMHHLEQCEHCRAEYESRVRLRSALREAVHNEAVPVGLDSRIRQRIRGERSTPLLSAPYWGAIAATLVVGIAGWVWPQRGPQPLHLVDVVAQNSYISRVSSRLPAVLRGGLGDHLHCSVSRKYPERYPKPDKAVDERKLGQEFTPLVPVVRQLIPNKYSLILAHTCGYLGRQFVHFTFRREDGKMLSLVVAPKQDRETFDGATLIPTLRDAGIPVYQDAADSYQVAGFESREYIAWVVSDLSGSDNVQIAASLAPAVLQYLDQLKG